MSVAAILELRGERALIVGGGRVAVRRARTLLDAGMRVHVISTVLADDLRMWPVTHEERPYRSGDVAGAAVVVAATDAPDVNDAVAAEARAAGILVNHAGDAGQGTLRFPAAFERAGVQVAISTGRELPLLAQALAEAIERLLPDAETLDAWTRRRETALVQPGTERDAALATLRRDIRAHLGLAGVPA